MDKVKNLTDRICEGMFGIYALWLAFSWRRIPSELPTHFGFNGEPDSFGGKGIMIIVPVIGFLLFLLLSFVEKRPEMWNYPVKVTDENREDLAEIGLMMMGFIKTILVFMELYISVRCANLKLPAAPIIISLIVLMAVIIVSIRQMIKVK